MIYHNGNVFTANSDYHIVEAVAIRDGRIVAVGSTERVLQLASETTQRIDLEGNTMLPGFFDNHVHVGGGGGRLMEWKGGLISEVPEWVRGITTIEVLQEAIRGQTERVGRGEWIVGSLSREVWPNQNLQIGRAHV